jgi:hypothetical protein
MRTTVNIADDVTAELDRLRNERSLGLSEALNELARAGMARQRPRRPFVQQTHDFGRTLIDVTNVAKAIELAEGPDHR